MPGPDNTLLAEKPRTPAGACALGVAALALALAALGPSGCASARVDAGSPRVLGASVASTSTGTEESQRVVVTVRYDRPIRVASQAADDLDIRVADAPLDRNAIAVAAASAGPRALAAKCESRPAPRENH